MADIKFDICLATEAKERGSQVKEDALRWNYDSKTMEFWNGSAWALVSPFTARGTGYCVLNKDLQFCWGSKQFTGGSDTIELARPFKNNSYFVFLTLYAQASPIVATFSARAVGSFTAHAWDTRASTATPITQSVTLHYFTLGVPS